MMTTRDIDERTALTRTALTWWQPTNRIATEENYC